MAAAVADSSGPIELIEQVPDWESRLIRSALAAGCSLRRAEAADTGQVVWSWVRDDGTGPAFLTRRAALDWMAAVLEGSDPQRVTER